jgi:hypothetical protein
MIELKSSEASIGGVARRISAAEKAQMAINAMPAILKATIHIKRAATGAVETYDITGTPVEKEQDK